MVSDDTLSRVPRILISVRMRAPQLLAVQLEHQIVGRIVDGVDLLENDLALEIEIRFSQERIEDQVGQHVAAMRTCSSRTRA